MSQNEHLLNKLTTLFFNWVELGMTTPKGISKGNYLEFSDLYPDELTDMEIVQLDSITKGEVADMIMKINNRLNRVYLQGLVRDRHGSKGVVIDEDIRALPS